MKCLNVSVLNCGIGNYLSVSRMVEHVGGQVQLVSKPDEVAMSSRIIIPGVGSFDHGMRQLKDHGLIDPLIFQMQKGCAILGICLGMQLLLDESEEGTSQGLGFVPGFVKKFRFDSCRLRIPHMGWADVHVSKSNPLLSGDEMQRFYFVHSYHAVPIDRNITIATSTYGYEFCAGFQKDNVYGVQFHPEKSHRFGKSLMKRFLEL